MVEMVIVGGALLAAAHLMRSALRALRSAAADIDRHIADIDNALRVADFDRWERELQELP